MVAVNHTQRPGGIPVPGNPGGENTHWSQVGDVLFFK